MKRFESVYPLRPLFFRKLKNHLITLFSWSAVVIAVGAMVWILGTVLIDGLKVITTGFLLNPSKPYGIPDAGIGNAILGTLMITGGAALLAVPCGVAAGIYLAEFGSGTRLGNGLRFCANVLMGMPSILVGLLVYSLMVVPMGSFSGVAGSVALAVIMFPVIMRTTEDMLLMVPASLREAALALGMTRTRAILRIVCTSARNGLLTGILLSLSRVSGETAPLLFTAMFADSWPKDYFTGPTANIPMLITEYTTNSPFEEMHAAGWGAAFVVSAIILFINITTRICFRERHHGK